MEEPDDLKSEVIGNKIAERRDYVVGADTVPAAAS
jgi:hypothetical protein